MNYQEWSSEQLSRKYKSLSADVACTEIFLKSQKEELLMLGRLLENRGIDVITQSIHP